MELGRDRGGAGAELTEAIAINPAEPASFYFRGHEKSLAGVLS